MWTALIVLMIAALLCGAAAFWVLRAYRRAGGGARSPRPALAICGAVALVAVGAYLAIGRPELPGGSFQDRLAALKQRPVETYTVDEALAVLSEGARQEPTDPLPHLYAGELLYNQGRLREAAREYDAALRREPRLAEAMLGLARSLVAIEGRVTPEALTLFQESGALTNDPTPWIYQAMAAMEQNNEQDARRLWGEAYTRMPEDDPRREMARRMSTGARQ